MGKKRQNSRSAIINNVYSERQSLSDPAFLHENRRFSEDFLDIENCVSYTFCSLKEITLRKSEKGKSSLIKLPKNSYFERGRLNK
ncbi:MAG: hypothetical protein CVU54_09870 [Deltaproteobacteria bacterium HGW-Deltaproteobacteria-12]|nr:MAG: hypothetical protein CVU54_09870 [Deltaproteobacteria bacterium HGW-Deltaproteobacteria-12]